MAIKKIKVQSLFHTFNHEINFDNNKITVIIGENGVGKTTMLRILYSILSNKIKFLFSIEFDSIEIEFDKTNWCITKKEEKCIEIKDAHHVKPYIIDKHIQDDDYIFFRDSFDTVMLEKWLEKESKYCDACGRQMNLHHHYYPYSSWDSKQDRPKWFEDCTRENHVIYIKTQRLFKINYNKDNRPRTLDDVVKIYAEDLVKVIQKDDSIFTAASIKLDSSFPMRLLKERKKKDQPENIKTIIENIHQLNQYRSLLSRAGIIDKQDDDVINKALESLKDRDSLSILKLYIRDTNEKLGVFKDTASKLEILQNIINKRFKHKKLFIDKKEGFVVKSKLDDRKIDITKLSSGEQNELIIFYNLLFKTNKNDIVMIDEPEISLHITWQQQLIDDFKEVAEVTGIKLIISTHSPDIVGDNWSLVQTLSGQE